MDSRNNKNKETNYLWVKELIDRNGVYSQKSLLFSDKTFCAHIHSNIDSSHS